MVVLETVALAAGYGIAAIYLFTALMVGVVKLGHALGFIRPGAKHGAVQDFLANFH